jgi:Uma2 family endonuclease
LVDKFVYPDISIVCGKTILGDKKQGINVLLNPQIIIEVLSKSAELYDRTAKFDAYKTLQSVQ